MLTLLNYGKLHELSECMCEHLHINLLDVLMFNKRGIIKYSMCGQQLSVTQNRYCQREQKYVKYTERDQMESDECRTEKRNKSDIVLRD